MSQEQELPQYPSLARCILIDARHGSRFELSKDLRSSLLFSQVFEAKSLSGALSTLEFEEMDACFLGPSVTPDKAFDFLKRAKDSVRSKDIAFIAVLNRGEEDNEEKLLGAGVHGVVKRPCTKLKLFDWVVRAVVAANGNGAWAAIFKQSGHDKLEIADVFAVKPKGDVTVNSTAPSSERNENNAAAPAAVQPPKSNAASASPQHSNAIEDVMFAAITKAAAPELQEIVKGIESGEYRLDPAGNPTGRAKEAIAKLVAGVVDKVDPKDSETERFAGFFEMALLQWFIDLIKTDAQEATSRLRQTLLTFKPADAE